MSFNWAGKISNHAQLGGIETAVLDNGPGRGTRIAWINTGTGLRYKVIIDRAMDIGDAFFNGHSLAWLSHSGVTSPQPFADRGTNWLRTFGGGLLTTCGLTHTGGPETDGFGERGLHGLISNTPAEIVSVIQPDLKEGLVMSITGIMKESRIFGPCLELKRTISGTVGRASIRIHDEVTNHGNTPAPHMILYHCNFGWPLVDERTHILWKGNLKARPGQADNKIFRDGNDFRRCPEPLDGHAGAGEEAAFIDVDADGSGYCTCGLYNPHIGIALSLRFRKEQLPWLTNWQHWGKGEYVTGLEPGTNPPVGQARAREQQELIHIAPGEKRNYDLEIDVLHEPDTINSFVKNLTQPTINLE